MRITQRDQKRIGFGFGALVGIFFFLIDKGFTAWTPSPSAGLLIAGRLVLAVGIVGLGVTILDTLSGNESLPAWFEGLVSGFVTIVGLGNLLLGLNAT